MSEKKKNIGDSKLLGSPNKMLGLRLKNGAVTSEKLAPNSITRDKLSELLKALLKKFEEDIAALQLAVGESADPEVIKEMIRDIIQEMIDDGDEIIDVDALIETIISRIDVGDTAILPIDGIAPSGTDINVIEIQVPEGTEGEILYYPSEKTFVFRVANELDPEQVTPETFSYYRYWPGFEPYTDFTQGTNNGKPKLKVFFVLRDGSAYYYWDGTTMQELVTQELVSNIVASKTEIVGTNGVSVIETTNPITNKKTQTASLADIPYAENVNKVGTTYVFDNSLPQTLTPNTRYVIANNVGNTDNLITMPQGSKVVPNGGIPTVPVEGGEMSWVHSSDIGMIQVTEEEIESGIYNIDNGITNRDIIRNVLASRYNLILDGKYYLYFSSKPNDHLSVDYNKNYAILLNRDFKIKGGGIIVPYTAFHLTECDFSAENVSFECPEIGASGYSLIVGDARKKLLGNVTFKSCTFKTPYDKNPYSGAYYYAIKISGTDVAPTSYSNPRYKWTYKATSNYPQYVSYYTAKYNSGGDKVNFKMRITDVSDQDRRFNISWSGQSEFMAEYHKTGEDLFVPNVEGTYVFIKDQASSTIHDSENGNFVVATPETVSDANVKTNNGSVVYYSHVPMETCEYQGISSLVVDDCTFIRGGIAVNSIAVYNNFTIRNSVFKDIVGTAIAYGTNNDWAYSGDWNVMSAPMNIHNNYFCGMGRVLGRGAADLYYHAPLLAETKIVNFKDNVVSNFISGFAMATYDCYLSANEVYVENNTFRNILYCPRPCWDSSGNVTNTIYLDTQGLLKSKSIVDTESTNEYYEQYKKLPFKVNRIYKNNKYIVESELIKDAVIEDIAYYYGGGYEQWQIEDGKTSFVVGRAKAALKEDFPEFFVGNTEDIDYEKIYKMLVLQCHLAGIVSTEGIDTMEISNNDFDLRGCIVTTSYRTNNIISDYIFNNNIVKARLFASTSAEYIEWYNIMKKLKPSMPEPSVYSLLSIYPTLRVPSNVYIEGNKFISEVKAVINLLGANDGRQMNSLTIKDNVFYNCDFRGVNTCLNTLNDDGTIAARENYYWGEIRAKKCDIQNNIVEFSNDDSSLFAISDKLRVSDDSTYLYRNYDLINTISPKYSFEDGVVEIESTQSEATEFGLGLTAPYGNGTLIIRSKKIIRPADKRNESEIGNLQNYTGTESVPDNSALTVSKYANLWTSETITPFDDEDAQPRKTRTLFNNAGIIVACLRKKPNTPESTVITVEYTKNGMKLCKRFEVTSWSRSDQGNVYPAVCLIRGYDGKRISCMTSGKIWYHVYELEDISLNLMLSTFNTGSNNRNLRPAVVATFYTDSNGTTNDSNTDIIITVKAIPTREYYNTVSDSSIIFSYDNATPISEFMQSGSTVSASWIEDKNELAKGNSATDTYIRSNKTTNILSPADKGFWVRDAETMRKYTWSGTAWIPETLVVTMTQAEYDALEDVDENTLYIIQNPTT